MSPSLCIVNVLSVHCIWGEYGQCLSYNKRTMVGLYMSSVRPGISYDRDCFRINLAANITDNNILNSQILQYLRMHGSQMSCYYCQ